MNQITSVACICPLGPLGFSDHLSYTKVSPLRCAWSCCWLRDTTIYCHQPSRCTNMDGVIGRLGKCGAHHLPQVGDPTPARRKRRGSQSRTVRWVLFSTICSAAICDTWRRRATLAETLGLGPKIVRFIWKKPYRPAAFGSFWRDVIATIWHVSSWSLNECCLSCERLW